MFSEKKHQNQSLFKCQFTKTQMWFLVSFQIQADEMITDYSMADFV